MSAAKKVLLVEDEFMLYEQLSEFLEDNGFVVVKHEEEDRAVDNYEDAVRLLHQHEPSFAILDVKIKGDRDGLELAAYIREYFTIPVIILTAFANSQNLDRATLTADGFVVKADKPLNKAQLWASIRMILPKIGEKNDGKFLKVKEIDIADMERRIGKDTSPQDPVELETYVKWDQVRGILTYNKFSNNNILFYMADEGKGFVYRTTLNDIEGDLPFHFVRFNQSCIVNARFITHKGAKDTIYYLGSMRVVIGDAYRDEALKKLKILL